MELEGKGKRQFHGEGASEYQNEKKESLWMRE
jgi:hypothetical protein